MSGDSDRFGMTTMDRRLLSMSCCNNKSGNNCNLYASSPLFLTTHTTSLSLSPDRPLLWAVAVAAPPYSRGNQTLGRSKAAPASSSAESRARVNAALQAPGCQHARATCGGRRSLPSEKAAQLGTSAPDSTTLAELEPKPRRQRTRAVRGVRPAAGGRLSPVPATAAQRGARGSVPCRAAAGERA